MSVLKLSFILDMLNAGNITARVVQMILQVSTEACLEPSGTGRARDAVKTDTKYQNKTQAIQTVPPRSDYPS